MPILPEPPVGINYDEMVVELTMNHDQFEAVFETLSQFIRFAQGEEYEERKRLLRSVNYVFSTENAYDRGFREAMRQIAEGD